MAPKKKKYVGFEKLAKKIGAKATKAHKDRLKGGLADKSKPSDFSKKQLEMGVKVEREHTRNKKIAREIAMDHLKEDPKYYTKLKKIHKKKPRRKK